jgi:KilA-N domain
LSMNELIIVITGGKKTKIRGSYVHPMLTTHIAYWISPKFAVKVGMWIEEWKKYSNKNLSKYYDSLSKLEPYQNNNKEKIIQSKLQKKLGGDIEVPTIFGNIDLVTNDKLIEIKTYDNWKFALGQVLAYGDLYNNKKKCIYLFDVPDDAKINVIKKLFAKHNVSLELYQ